MKKNVLAFVFCLLICGMSILQSNAQEDMVRPSTKTDLVGRWNLDKLVIDPLIMNNTTDPWLSKYQFFEFTDLGKMKHMVANKPITDEDIKTFDLFSTATDSNYEIDERGALKLTNAEWKHPMYYLCSYVIEDIILPDGDKVSKGNILLYSYGQNGNIIASYELEKIGK